MLSLETPVSQISKVGKTVANRLKNLGVEKAYDLLFYFPFRHDDFSQVIKINQLKPEIKATVIGRIDFIESRRSPRKKKLITEALVSDETGSVKAIWFNQPYIAKILKIGDNIFLSGKTDFSYIGFAFSNPSYEKASQDKTTTHTARLVPIYSLTSNLTQKQIRFLIKLVLPLGEKIKDWLPEEIKKDIHLLDLKEAIQQIHFPDDKKDFEKARLRLKFDELFLIQLEAQWLRKELAKSKAYSLKFFQEETRHFVRSLPFILTEAQRKTAWQIIKDLTKNQPMNRLLEGDVGSGKTVVAVLAILNVLLNNYQTAYMAPTEILAKQHFENIKNMIKNFNICLLTKSAMMMNNEEIKKNVLLKKIKEGEVNLIIGTHSLIQEKARFNKLALAIIDEQHRFGVEQRHLLLSKSGTKIMPHLLSMTATPIPRTLALTLYGDLDLSIIDQMPKNRKKIITQIISPSRREEAYQFVEEEVKKGRQVFVICPLIDPSDKLGVKSVKEEYQKLKEEVFPYFKVDFLHGKMKSREKEKIMHKFLSNETNILVSTSVIEVGIDVPNATVMMIEGAERFGLAQLHQFRGRVGRSSYQSYCLLFPEEAGERTQQRLRALVSSFNGFQLAEFDLEFRGPGEIYGVRQSGLPELRIAKLTDFKIIQNAKEQAEKIIIKDPNLFNYPLLKEKLDLFTRSVHLE